MRLLSLLLVPSLATAADITWQGRVLDAAGGAVSGSHPVVLTLYDAPTGGTAVHTENVGTVPLDDGYLAVTATVPDDTFVFGQSLYVEVSLDGTPLGPRQPVRDVPTAASAGHVRGFVDLEVLADVTTNPACAVQGRLVYDGASGQVFACDGTTYVSVGGSAADGSSQARAAQSCRAIHDDFPGAASGAYWLDTDADGNTADAFQTWCDMDRDGGGWTLVMQNVRGVNNLTPTWAEATGENVVIAGATIDNAGSADIIVGLTYWNEIGDEARIEMGTAFGTRVHGAKFSSFNLEGPNYALYLGGITVVAGTAQPGWYSYHAANHWQFSTRDRDNDATGGQHCAVSYGNTAWWFGSCWDGSLWGHTQTDPNEGGHWSGSGGPEHNWAAIWVR